MQNNTTSVLISQKKDESSEGFRLVKNGSPPRKVKPFIPITTTNRFSIPGFENPDEPEIRLVGDSLVRGQLDSFCGRNPQRRRRFCVPGGRIEDVSNAVDIFTDKAPDNATYVLHVGTNDISTKSTSEEILRKYRALMKKMREKTKNIIFSGILPRLTSDESNLGRAKYVNNILKSFCKEEGFYFADFWNDFYGQADLFLRDGLHLNAIGEARFGRLLNKSVCTFLQTKEMAVVKTT